MKYSVYELGEKAILLFIGIGAFCAAVLQIIGTVQTFNFDFVGKVCPIKTFPESNKKVGHMLNKPQQAIIRIVNLK